MISRKELPIMINQFNYSAAKKDYRVLRHSHSALQWFYVFKGGIQTVIDGKSHYLEANDSLLIPPGAMRSPRLYKSAPTYTNIVFNLRDININHLFLKVIPLPSYMIPTAETLIREARSPGTKNSLLYQHTLFLSIILELERFIKAKQQNEGELLNHNNAEEIAERLLTFMRTNLHRPITRDDFADLVNLSISQISRLFSAATGKSLITALTELRIEKAQNLLIDSTHSITRIGIEVGFNSFSHFTQTFKKYTGISPSEYRKKN
ncbi:MAG: helix-turn-helix domain-containing protein [Planctomycetota bacterium]